MTFSSELGSLHLLAYHVRFNSIPDSHCAEVTGSDHPFDEVAYDADNHRVHALIDDSRGDTRRMRT